MDKNSQAYKFTEIVALKETMHHLWMSFENSYKEAGQFKSSDLNHLLKMFKSTNKSLVRLVTSATNEKNEKQAEEIQQVSL